MSRRAAAARRRATDAVAGPSVATRSTVVMADVMRELEAVADLARDHDAPEVVEACVRATALLERLRDQFVVDLTGPIAPSDRPIDLAEAREQRRAGPREQPRAAPPAAGSAATEIPAAG